MGISRILRDMFKQCTSRSALTSVLNVVQVLENLEISRNIERLFILASGGINVIGITVRSQPRQQGASRVTFSTFTPMSSNMNVCCALWTCTTGGVVKLQGNLTSTCRRSIQRNGRRNKTSSRKIILLFASSPSA